MRGSLYIIYTHNTMEYIHYYMLSISDATIIVIDDIS